VVVELAVAIEVVTDEVASSRFAHSPAEFLARRVGLCDGRRLDWQAMAGDAIQLERLKRVAPRIPLGEADFTEELLHPWAVVVATDLVNPELRCCELVLNQLLSQ